MVSTLSYQKKTKTQPQDYPLLTLMILKMCRKSHRKKMSTLTPASLVLTDNILKEFGRSVVESRTNAAFGDE